MRNRSRSGVAILVAVLLFQAFLAPWIDAICRHSAKYKREHVAQPFTANFRP
jgi:hypothetical protein